MTQGAIPGEVLTFISAQIDSVPQLETLLLLWRDPARSWNLQEIAARIYTTVDDAKAILHSLVHRRLIRHPEGNTALFQFDSEWDKDRQVMTLVADAYQRQLIQVATYIHSRASASVREFARAFDFKKEH